MNALDMLGRLRQVCERFMSGEVARDGARRLYLAGRDGFRYSDGARSVLIETETLTGRVNRVIYAGLITNWLPPHETESISPEQRSEIVRTVYEFLVEQGRVVEVDWEPKSGDS
jgi:hypothetical protein